MEAHVASTESGHRNAHPFQRLCVKYVQATATIHQNLSQSSAFDDWVDHQSLPPGGGYVRRVIRLVECDGRLRPLQIIGRCRSSHIHFSVYNFQSVFSLHISKNHQRGIDLWIFLVTVLLVLNLVRLFFFVLGLLPLELLYQESTLSSGMLRVNEVTLFIFLGVDVTWQIHHVISFFIFYFLGVPRPLGLPLELSLI